MRQIILSVATGHFTRGLCVLETSLECFWNQGVKLWFDEYPPGSPTHEQEPYAFKAYAMKWALDSGYDQALWVDSSIYAIDSPAPVFQCIENQGHYFMNNGYNAAQTCPDQALDILNLTRDQAEKIPEVVGGFWGLDFRRSVSREFLDRLIKASVVGAFRGDRNHNVTDSADPRFLFARHDQSVMSCLAYLFGLQLNLQGGLFHWVSGENPHPNKGSCFVLNRF